MTQEATAELGLAQLTAVATNAIILLLQPQFAMAVVLFLGLMMALSMGSAMAVGYHYSSKGIEQLSQTHASQLGTHFGGILCYLVMIGQAFDYLRV